MANSELLNLLVHHSYRFSDTELFPLASGRKSPFYVNCKTTTMRSDAARLIADAFEAKIPPAAEAIGGLTMGADPIAYAIRDLSARHLDVFVVRKEAKAHGLRRGVEGPVRQGLKVVVVDDVVTTGGSTIQALDACRAEGLDVVAVVVLVDREEDGGLDRIRAHAQCPVAAIFRVSELHERWQNLDQRADEAPSRPAAASL